MNPSGRETGLSPVVLVAVTRRMVTGDLRRAEGTRNGWALTPVCLEWDAWSPVLREHCSLRAHPAL